jgi:hypothetical protein
LSHLLLGTLGTIIGVLEVQFCRHRTIWTNASELIEIAIRAVSQKAEQQLSFPSRALVIGGTGNAYALLLILDEVLELPRTEPLHPFHVLVELIHRLHRDLDGSY